MTDIDGDAGIHPRKRVATYRAYHLDARAASQSQPSCSKPQTTSRRPPEFAPWSMTGINLRFGKDPDRSGRRLPLEVTRE